MEGCQGASKLCWRKLNAEGSSGLFWLALGEAKVLGSCYNSQGAPSALVGQVCSRFSLSPEEVHEQGTSTAHGVVRAGRVPVKHLAVQPCALPAAGNTGKCGQGCHTLCSTYSWPCKSWPGGFPASQIPLPQRHQHRAQPCTPASWTVVKRCPVGSYPGVSQPPAAQPQLCRGSAEGTGLSSPGSSLCSASCFLPPPQRSGEALFSWVDQSQLPAAELLPTHHLPME